MRRLLVLLTLAVGLGLLGTSGIAALAACGGNDKPPLTPDLVEPSADEAGTPPTTPPAK